jgi:CRAL/TRIO domain
MNKEPRHSKPNLEICASRSEQSTIESRLLEIDKFAEKEDRLDVIGSFRVEFLTYCLSDQQLKPADVWKGIKKCVDSYPILKQYEEKMDHARFVEYLRTELGSVSGNAKDGTPIFWLKALKNSYRYKIGSSETSAWIRAYIWMLEITRLKAGKDVEILILVDDSQRKVLDFNFPLTRELISVAVSLNPFCNDKTMIFGAGRGFRTLWNLISEVLGPKMKSVSFCDKKDDVLDIVANVDDIPAWWMHRDQQDEGALSRNKLWEWERCLERGRRTTTAKDIFNPDKPWTIIEEKGVHHSSSGHTNCLEAIAESEDEV